MGSLKGKTATARRGENGEVVYDMHRQEVSNNPATWPQALYRSLHKDSAARKDALNDLLRSEEAAAKNNTTSLSGGAGNVSGQHTGGSVATTATQTQATEGNPGMGDPEANADIDLSTSDTTARRKAGYRRDSGLRI